MVTEKTKFESLAALTEKREGNQNGKLRKRSSWIWLMSGSDENLTDRIIHGSRKQEFQGNKNFNLHLS